MYSSNVILLRLVSTVSRQILRQVSAHHIVDSAEETIAIRPFTVDLRIVLCLVTSSVLLAREATLGRLRTSCMPAKESLRMPSVMLP